MNRVSFACNSQNYPQLLLINSRVKALLCLLSFFLFLSKAPSQAAEVPEPVDGVLTITVTAQGELYSDYSVSDFAATTATTLKLVGPLNDNDFKLITKVISETMSQLDLSEAVMTEIPSMAFAVYEDYHYIFCDQLTAITLPEGITSISSSAFYGCKKLASINIPATVSSIGSSAFYNCQSLTTFSCAVTGTLTIGSSAFQSCSALTTITIEAGGDVSFDGSSTFSNCNALATLDLTTPGKVIVPDNMFYVGTDGLPLRRITLNATGAGSTIGQYAFEYCRNLEEVLLPAGLVSLGRAAFRDCNKLESIDIPATTVITDGYDMFSNCSKLQSINLGQLQLSALGTHAFYGCAELTSVTLPDDFEIISDGMFQGCSKLSNFNMPATITSIGQYAFRDCSKLPAITIPASVTAMDKYAFQNCTSLTTAVISANVATLPDRTFEGCSSLRTVTMDGSAITTIDDRVFSGCSQLADITLPSVLTTLRQYAFYNCSSLSMISLPATLTTLGNGVFNGCSGLISLEIPEGVSELPQSVFSGCTGMQSLYLPSTITTIHYSAFDNLNSLVDLHIQATTPPPFSTYSRASLVSLFVPEASISAYQEADYWKNFGHIYAELTNLATLDDDDYALLQQFYASTYGSTWKRPWTFGATKAQTPMLEGVKVNDGHVVQIVLIDNGLRGSLPQELMQFPRVWYINVSRNHFSGDIGTYFDNMAVNNVITHLDLSDNYLSGNIGMMGNVDSSLPTEKLPALTSFKIARNNIRDVKPVLPSHITTLDIRGQQLLTEENPLTEQPYTFRDFVEAQSALMPDLFPSILTYDHSRKNYNSSLFILSAPDADVPWTVSMQKNNDNVQTTIYNYSSLAWNYLPTGSYIYLSNHNTNVAERNILRINFNYQMGDVNYNYDVEVSDLQTLINFAMQFESYQSYLAFNWAAANIIPADGDDPEVINVQDVVAEVNLLLEEDYNPSLARRRRLSRSPYPTEAGSDYPATLTIESGQLVLESEQPVAALDLTVSGGVEWSSELSLFSHKSRGSRTIFYSLFGDVLPAGRIVLGSVPANAVITAASLASAEGSLIPVSLSTDSEVTGILSVGSDGVVAHGTEETYDLQGRKVRNPKRGLYIVKGKKVVIK